ncbi:MAG TPA: hypothetical protein DEV81_17625, partial [Cyanobacteria bacterium UBA11049]|nr:hypothetical protein [Cyanobacteria bacterium UBA11049]
MKAEEVLKRYRAGERNFRRVKLQGQSFKDEDLSGADFSEADIRGANFTKANLKGANFSHARAGLQRRWAIVLLIVSFLLSALLGIISLISGGLTAYFFSPEIVKQYNILPGVVFLVVIVVFFIIAIRQGLGAVA